MDITNDIGQNGVQKKRALICSILDPSKCDFFVNSFFTNYNAYTQLLKS